MNTSQSPSTIPRVEPAQMVESETRQEAAMDQIRSDLSKIPEYAFPMGLLLLGVLFFAGIVIPSWLVPSIDQANLEAEKLRYSVQDQYRSLLTTIVGGSLGVIAIYLTLRRTQAIEKRSEVMEAQLLLSRETAASEARGQDAATLAEASKLLTSKFLVKRLGGIFALELLCTTSVAQYRQAMGILANYICSYGELGKSSRQSVETALRVIGRRFDETSGDRADERRAVWIHLQGANLSERNLRGNFSRVSFSRANLNGATMNRTNLRESYLKSATLDKTDLRSADLRDAVIDPDQLGTAFIDEYTLVSFPKPEWWSNRIAATLSSEDHGPLEAGTVPQVADGSTAP